MDKAFSLQASEMQQYEEVFNERQRLLAQFGALTLDMEACRQQITALTDRERTTIRGFVARHGITEFLGARVENGNLICRLPDAPPPLPAPIPLESKSVSRPNGPEPA